ncbi:RIO1 family regulatory kinase/ATPase [Bacillus sp. ISL-7]|uniref:RIO1 family regulatory kinase/ATPase domain-containing protein n=1 Tax=Bacillus sp. ISL-7 TaxID=2819136 RepID=UPI001BECCD36|nr:RIO1 family regulatory kinase/ATPase [Bacillus sp. ISL-7]MBT2734800.1 kinase [Bacillus sp. ISL-7]
MKDFEKIVAKNKGTVTIQDLSGYTMIGKGADGSVFQLTPEKCVKVFVNEDTQKKELSALQIGQSSPIIPKLYEYGSNYIVMEFVKGYNLKHLLKKEKKLSEAIVGKILSMLDEMKAVGFTRLDIEVRHIFFNELGEIKVIDLKRAFYTDRAVPTKLLSGLKKLGYSEEFLQHVNKLNPSKYKEWKNLGIE